MIFFPHLAGEEISYWNRSEASKCTALQGKTKEVSWQPFQNQCGIFCFACATWRCRGGRVKWLPVDPCHWRRGRSLGLVEGAQYHVSMTVPASIFVYQPLVPPQSICLALEVIHLHPLILETSKSGYTGFPIAKNLWATENHTVESLWLAVPYSLCTLVWCVYVSWLLQWQLSNKYCVW